MHLLLLPEKSRLASDIPQRQHHRRLRALVCSLGAATSGQVCFHVAGAAGVDEDFGSGGLLLVVEGDGAG